MIEISDKSIIDWLLIKFKDYEKIKFLTWIKIRYTNNELQKSTYKHLFSLIINDRNIQGRKMSTIESQFLDLFLSKKNNEDFIQDCLKKRDEIANILTKD